MDLEHIDQEFGHSVRLVRQEREMSQEDLAATVSKLGARISQATVGKIERGERKVTIGEAEAIARALSTSTNQLILGPSFVTQELLAERLHTLRSDLIDAMRNFESAQQLVAIESKRLNEHDIDLLRGSVLESLEDIVAEYREDMLLENETRDRRESVEGDNAGLTHEAPTVEGLLKEYRTKFGNRVEQGVRAKALETITRQQAHDTDG